MNEAGSVSVTAIVPVLVLAVFGFTFFWCLISFVLSRISGWAALARAYPAASVLTPHARFGWQSARMNGNAKYNGALTIVADAAMAHFSMFTLLRVGHESFSVPWADMRAEIRQLLLTERVALTFARAPGVTMVLSTQLADRLADAGGGRLERPHAAQP